MGGGGGNFVSDINDSISDVYRSASREAERFGEFVSDTTDQVKKVANTTGVQYAEDFTKNLVDAGLAASTFGLSEVADELYKGELTTEDVQGAGKDWLSGNVMSWGGKAAFDTAGDIMEDQAMKAERSAREQAERDIAEFEKLNRPFYDPQGLEVRRQRLQRGMYGFGDTMLTMLGGAKGASTRTGG